MLGRVIGGAAKMARIRLKADNLTPQDREDILASAALGSVKANAALGSAKPCRRDPKGYEFVSAKNEAMKFILSQIFREGMIVEFDDSQNYEDEEDLNFISEFGQSLDEAKLADMFLKHRKKKGQRGYEASKRDARICKLLLEGYGNIGIAQELGIPETHVRRYRTDINKRLQKLANV